MIEFIISHFLFQLIQHYFEFLMLILGLVEHIAMRRGRKSRERRRLAIVHGPETTQWVKDADDDTYVREWHVVPYQIGLYRGESRENHLTTACGSKKTSNRWIVTKINIHYIFLRILFLVLTANDKLGISINFFASRASSAKRDAKIKLNAGE